MGSYKEAFLFWCVLVALPGSVITMKVPEMAFCEPSLHYQLQDDKATWRLCAFLGNVSVATYDLILGTTKYVGHQIVPTLV